VHLDASIGSELGKTSENLTEYGDCGVHKYIVLVMVLDEWTTRIVWVRKVEVLRGLWHVWKSRPTLRWGRGGPWQCSSD